MDDSREILIQYIKSALDLKKTPILNFDDLSEEDKELGKMVQQLVDWAREADDFAACVARGDLNPAHVPVGNNVFTENLKSLQMTLCDLTWHTKKIANGEFIQEKEYPGEIGGAFNEMVHQLKERTTALENERNLFICFTESAKERIVVLDEETGEFLFGNRMAREFHQKNIDVLEEGKEMNRNSGCSSTNPYSEWIHTVKVKMENGEWETQYYRVHSVFIIWENRGALAHLFADATEDQKVRDLAMRDPLTGLYNRRYAMEYLEGLIQREQEFSLAFIDVDYLKFCNDELGHSAGDHYILQISKLLHGLVEQGIVCRVGGDEFILISKREGKESLEHRLEVARGLLKEEKFTDVKQVCKSYSYGVVEKSIHDGQNIHEILGLADERMYAYKLEYKKKNCIQIQDKRLE